MIITSCILYVIGAFIMGMGFGQDDEDTVVAGALVIAATGIMHIVHACV